LSATTALQGTAIAIAFSVDPVEELEDKAEGEGVPPIDGLELG
jgi:hypothetical protein